MNKNKLFEPFQLGNITLENRIVMAPMTRSRAINNTPNELIAVYYGQRAGAGLIITEGISPSSNGLGYARIPGLFSDEQVKGWKLVTEAVHKKGGKIFAQLMHTGRIAHQANLPVGAKVVAPSAIKASGKMWTDSLGMQEHPVPEALSLEELKKTKEEFVRAAKNAIIAGFDGIELHGANGYLLEQFLSPHSNKREDEYGGSIENRSRFVLEVAKETADAIGKERVAIRLSPYGAFNDMPVYDEIEETYKYLAGKLSDIGIVYIHLVDHSSQGAPEVPRKIKETIGREFMNTLILSGGYDFDAAAAEIEKGIAGLVAFGKPFINNPDLVERLMNGYPLNNELDTTTFYSADAKGYTDYPFYHKEKELA